jgi:L-alanine-DL-glutamate epimerase-like enolase superfamily enzyme
MAMPEVVTDSYRLADGVLTVPEAPGFGLDLDEERFARRVQEGGWALEASAT